MSLTLPAPTAAPVEVKADVKFDEAQHPRDSKGRFIETGAEVRILGGALGKVLRNVGGGRIEVQREADGKKVIVHRNYLTVTKRPDGSAPTSPHEDAPTPVPVKAPSKDAVEADHDPSTPARSSRPAASEGLASFPDGGDESATLTARQEALRAARSDDRVGIPSATILREGDTLNVASGHIPGQKQPIVGRVLGFGHGQPPGQDRPAEYARLHRADGTEVNVPLDGDVGKVALYVPGREPFGFRTTGEDVNPNPTGAAARRAPTPDPWETDPADMTLPQLAAAIAELEKDSRGGGPLTTRRIQELEEEQNSPDRADESAQADETARVQPGPGQEGLPGLTGGPRSGKPRRAPRKRAVPPQDPPAPTPPPAPEPKPDVHPVDRTRETANRGGRSTSEPDPTPAPAPEPDPEPDPEPPPLAPTPVADTPPASLDDADLTSEREANAARLTDLWRAGTRDGNPEFDALLARNRDLVDEQDRRDLAAIDGTPQPTPARDVTAGATVVAQINGRYGAYKVQGRPQRTGGTVRYTLTDRQGDTVDYEVSDDDSVLIVPGAGDRDLGDGIDVGGGTIDDTDTGAPTVAVADLKTGDRVNLAGRNAEVTGVHDNGDGQTRTVDLRYPDGTSETAPFGNAVVLDRADQPRSPAVEPFTADTVTARPTLYTYQRRNLVALGFDLDPEQSATVRQAAARVWARMPLSAEQNTALADAIRARAGQPDTQARQQRSLNRLAWRFDAAAAEAEGRPAPELPGQTVTPTRPDGLGVGDTVALPSPGGRPPLLGKVAAVRTMMRGRLTEVTVEHPDGTRETRLLTRDTHAFVVPDLPDNQPVIPGNVHEWVDASDLRVGDRVQYRSPRNADGDKIATVTAVNTDEEGDLRVTLDVNHDNPYATTASPATLTDRNKAIRVQRGQNSADQPAGSWTAPPGEREDIDPADLKVGDYVDIDPAGIGRVVGWVAALPANGQLLQVLPESRGGFGTQGIMSVRSVARLAPNDGGVEVRIQQIQREREIRQRAFGMTLEMARVRNQIVGNAATQAGLGYFGNGVPEGRTGDLQLADFRDRISMGVNLDGPANALAAQIIGDGKDRKRVADVADRIRPTLRQVQEATADSIVESIRNARPLPGETPGQAVMRVVRDLESDPPRTADIEGAGRALAQLSNLVATAGETVDAPAVAIPEGVDLGARITAYRSAIGGTFGHSRQRVATFKGASLASLATGEVPEVEWTEIEAPDRAADRGPGATAMRHLDIVHAAGRELDQAIQADIAATLSREFADTIQDGETIPQTLDRLHEQMKQLNDEVGRLRQARGERVRAERDRLARESGHENADAMTRALFDASPEERAMLRQKIRDHGLEAERIAGQVAEDSGPAEGRLRNLDARRRALVTRMATAQREAVIRALQNVAGVPMGGTGMDAYWQLGGGRRPALTKPLKESDPKAKAMRLAEASYPKSWLAKWRARQARLTPGGRAVMGVKGVQRGHYADNGIGTPYIALSERDNLGGIAGKYSTVAVHELGHAMERSVPGIVQAEEALLWSRVADGEIGSRRLAPLRSIGGSMKEVGWEDDFKSHYTGRSYDGAATGTATNFEVFTTAVESLLGGSDYLDDGLRQWTIGVIALLGHDE